MNGIQVFITLHPALATIQALGGANVECVIASDDMDSLAVYQAVGCFFARGNKYPLKSWARNVHPLGTFLLLQPFQIL